MKQLKHFALFALVLLITASCNRVQPNYEGVLMTNYGRNGESDFTVVTGAQGMLWAGSELYQVPLFEQKADPESLQVLAQDAGKFTVDPSYTYQAIKNHGVKIIFNYKHVGIGDSETIMDNIEGAVLNNLVVNAYREEARAFTTDSLMKNLNTFENRVEERLKKDFATKHFQLNSLTSGLTPPESLGEAIETRNKVKEQVNTARNQLEEARMQLERAKIDAETNRVRASGLDQKVLTEKWIEAIRTGNNKVIITDGKTPILLGN